jgi:ketosteroid isomerase-like protein
VIGLSRWMRLAVPGLLAVASGARHEMAAQAPAIDTTAILAAARPEIDAANRDWVTGFRQHRVDLIAAAYADSGLFIAPDGAVTAGRAAIRRMYEVRLAGMSAARGGAVIRDGSVVGAAGMVYEWGHAWLEFASDTPGAAPIRRGGGYLTVWQRQQDGHWRIVRDLAL